MPVPRVTSVVAFVLALGFAAPTLAMPDGVVTELSRHGPEDTVARFMAAVHASGWVVFARIDHAAAARAVGLELRPRMVILFGNPRAGTLAMAAVPTLALDLPMRALVWQDEDGRTLVTRSTGADVAHRVFARHGIGIPPEQQVATDAVLAGLVRRATE